MTRARTTAMVVTVLAASAIGGREARAEERPMRVDYQAHEGCPRAEVLVEEIRWRTPLARVAMPYEVAHVVVARIDRRGKKSRGRLVVSKGKERITRTITGESCDEVVGALGLVTALAIDPRASTARTRPPPPPPAPPPLPRDPRLPEALPAPAPPEIIGDPLPAEPEYASVAPAGPPRWSLSARASTAIAVARRPLFGGGLVAERLLDPRWGTSLRLVAEVAGTGSSSLGEGQPGASFLRVVGRLEGCALSVRLLPWFWFSPCVSAEGGMLRAEGVLGGSLTYVQAANAPWFGLGLLPRVVIERGPFFFEAQGGPVFPLVRRTFEFATTPPVTVHEVPPVTGTVSLGAGYVFP